MVKNCLSNCKINIGLRILRRRSDGYHDIETIFYPIPLYDEISVSALETGVQDAADILTVTGIPLSAASDDNLVMRVVRMLREEGFRIPPLHISLHKNIPSGAGLGGGSSNAAFTMKLLNELFRLGLSETEMEQRVGRLGADCAFFVRNKPVLAEGIGNVFTPVNVSLKDKYIALVKPDVHVSTAGAYAAIDSSTGKLRTPAPSHLRDLIENTPVHLWRNVITNDFEPYVFSTYPKVAAIKQTLYDMGALYASMSGSGSAVYGIFNRPVDNASKVFADCFTFAGSLAFS